MERRYPRRPGRFWTWRDPAPRGPEGPPKSLHNRVLMLVGAVTGLVVGLTASWLLLLIALATAFLLLVAVVVLLFTSLWPWAIMLALAAATLLLRRLRRASGRPPEPRDIRDSF